MIPVRRGTGTVTVTTRRTLLLLIVVLGAALRLVHLDSLPLWIDELSTRYRASGSFFDVFVKQAKFATHPPLYYLLVRLVALPVGITDLSIRFVGYLASVATIPAIYWLGKKLDRPSSGLWAAFLLASSPYAVYYAQEAKAYSLVWLFSVVGFYQLLRLRETRDLRWTTAFAITSFAAWSTSYIGFLQTVLQLAVFAFWNRDRPPPPTPVPGSPQRSLSKPLMMRLALGFALYTPWFVVLILRKVELVNGMVWNARVERGPIEQLARLAREQFHLEHIGADHGRMTIAVMVTVCLLAFVLRRPERGTIWSREPGLPLFLIWILLPPLLLALFDSLFLKVSGVPRYLGFIHLAIVLLIGQMLASLGTIRAGLTATLLSGYLTAMVLVPYYQLNRKIANQPWKWAFTIVNQHQEPGQLIFGKMVRPRIDHYVRDTASLRFPGDDFRNWLAQAPEGEVFFLVRPGRSLPPFVEQRARLQKRWGDGNLDVFQLVTTNPAQSPRERTPTQQGLALPDSLIFQDDFESGDSSAWRSGLRTGHR